MSFGANICMLYDANIMAIYQYTMCILPIYALFVYVFSAEPGRHFSCCAELKKMSPLEKYPTIHTHFILGCEYLPLWLNFTYFYSQGPRTIESIQLLP